MPVEFPFMVLNKEGRHVGSFTAGSEQTAREWHIKSKGSLLFFDGIRWTDITDTVKPTARDVISKTLNEASVLGDGYRFQITDALMRNLIAAGYLSTEPK